MNTNTYKKLNPASDAVYQKFGIEALELSNLEQLILDEVRKIENPKEAPLHPRTVERNIGHVRTRIKNQHQYALNKAKVQSQIKPVDNEENYVPGLGHALNFPAKNTVKTILVTYKDGSTQTFVTEVIEQKPVEKQPEVWFGLFDYRSKNEIIIRRGTRTGCNICNLKSIVEYFGSAEECLDWCYWSIFPGNYTRNPDTDRNLQTLYRLINYLEDVVQSKNSR